MSEYFCGTGTGNFPKPGDPDSRITLWATSAFGGIDLHWTFPGINPHAVAHFIINRGFTDIYEHSARLGEVHGSFYHDRIEGDTETLYYYWVQVVSINGTYGEIIGPASARARPLIGDLITLLTGQIDKGVLAQSLKEDIAEIQLNKLAIDNEILERARTDDALGASLNQVTAFTENTRALLEESMLLQAEENSVFADAVNTLYASMGTDKAQATAALQEETRLRISEDQLLSGRITTAQNTLNGNIASVQTTLQTNIDVINGVVRDIGALYTAKVSVNGLIGGFGVYNDGSTVEAGFDVDRFWVGRTNANKRKPFIIENDEVFIDQAAINKLTFSKLRDESGSVVVENGRLKAQYITVGDIQSDNYIAGSRGWALKK